MNLKPRFRTARRALNWVTESIAADARADLAAEQNYAALDLLYKEDEGDNALSADARSKVTDAENNTEESDRYFLYLCAYELLNAWSWDENTLFGDYFLSLGEADYTTVDTLRALYPPAEGLSGGQLAMAEIAVLKSDGTACLSVWDGVDLTIYEEEVALTSEAQRQMDAANSYDSLTKGSAWEEGLDIAMTKVGIASSVISLMTLVTGIVTSIPVFMSAGFAEGAAAIFAANSIYSTCFAAALNIGTNVLAGIFGLVGAAVVAVSYIILAAMLIILLVKLFTWIVSLFTSERDAEALDYGASDIPLTLYDYRSGDYVKYTAVTDGQGSASDLNAFEGLRFAAFYVSRDPAAGEPLRVPDSADAFLLKRNNAACPEGYTPVPLIGGSNAENLNFYADEEDADQLYLFFTRENVKAEESGAEGTEQESGENAGTSGTPIYANLLVTSDRADCWDNGVYLFFEPTEKFTSGTKYLGGLTMVLAEEWDSVYHPLSKLLSAYGYRLLSTENISEGFTVYAKDEETYRGDEFRGDFHYGTFLAYSETYNPYRAIYGLRSYTAAPQTESLTISLGSASSGAYVVCDTLFQVYHGAKVGLSRDSEDDVYAHGVSANHSYFNIGSFGGGLAEIYCCEKGIQTPEYYETVSWTCAEEPRLKGLYVQGPVSGAEPLTVSDLLVSSDSSEENHQKLLSEGYSSVQDFRTPNRTEPHSLGYGTVKPKYLYVKRTAQTAGKYIKAISVVSWNAESSLGDAYGDYSEEQLEQIDLMADNICVGSLISQVSDEILPLNLAVSYEETWQADPENAPRQVAYIGVTRTDNVLEAVRSVIRFTPEEGITASSTIKVGGVTYTRAWDRYSWKKSDGAVSLNEGTGGRAIYIYYTCDSFEGAESPIMNLGAHTISALAVCLSSLPALYFSFKYLIFPDDALGYIKSLRKYHFLACLMLLECDLECVAMSLASGSTLYSVVWALNGFLLSAVYVLTMLFLVRGCRKWKA